MNYTFEFTAFAKKKLLRLDKEVQERIQTKLLQLKKHPDIHSSLKQLVDYELVTHRLRIGDYRVILRRTSISEFRIIDIGHRKDVYE